MNRALVLTLALATLLLLAACGAEQQVAVTEVEPAAETMVEESSEMASEEMVDEDEPMAEHDDGAMGKEMAAEPEAMAEEMEETATSAELPLWQTLPLADARSGETFTLADFAGQTVFVEPMATWCTNCRRQLENVKEARAQLAGEDVVFVTLSVETNIDDATLASYADEAGFGWLFAVLTPEMLQELAGEFGQTIANPPATPHFVIRPDGSVASLYTGIEPAERIVAQIELAQG
jgi:thiol-disulfide isomerase/thioredoxin